MTHVIQTVVRVRNIVRKTIRPAKDQSRYDYRSIVLVLTGRYAFLGSGTAAIRELEFCAAAASAALRAPDIIRFII